MRENRATIKDEGLGAAFTEGVNEAFRLTGYVMVFLTVGSQERDYTVKASEVPKLIGDFVAGLRGDEYDQGVVIRIMAADAPAEAVDDAEVIEGQIVEE